jgi:hypothetical protein
MNCYMEKVKIYFDKTRNTLTVWFGNPMEEYICEETGSDIIIMNDKEGDTLGFEKLNYSKENKSDRNIVFETTAV